MFALSAVGYRGAILSLELPNFVLAATFTLAVGLVLQAALLTLYLALRDRAVLSAIARAWRPSLFAGFMGATASQFWFLAFALDHRRQRAHARAGRGAVRAGDLVFRVQAEDHAARGVRHVADRGRRGAADLGAVNQGIRPRGQGATEVTPLKIILSLSLLILAATLGTACAQDQSQTPPKESKEEIKCVTSDTSFQRKGDRIALTITLQNACEQPHRCTVNAYTTSAFGARQDEKRMTLAPKSKGEKSKNALVIMVRSASGSTMSTFSCKKL